MKRTDFEAIREEVKNLKAEVDVLKQTIKYLSAIKSEGKTIKKYVYELKAKIKGFKAKNVETFFKLRMRNLVRSQKMMKVKLTCNMDI